MPKSSKSRPARTAAPVRYVNIAAQHRALRPALLRAMDRVIQDGHFILGPETQALEKELAGRCRAGYALGVNSGTDALVLALRSLNIGPGHEVIVPDFTFVATASAVLLVGATPVLADVEPGTLTLDPAQAAAKVTPRTRALIPVHLYGQAADMTRLLKLAAEKKLAVVEDAAQALGATWQGRPVGALGDAGCLSFYPTKNLGGMGDGGMLLTNRPDLAARLKRLRDHGSDKKYIHEELGLNSRLDEIQSAVLRIKLKKLEAWHKRRRAIANQYFRAWQDLPLVLPKPRPGAEHVYHQFTIQTPRRDELQRHLAALGISTGVHYPMPLHCQPLLSGLPSASAAFPVSERAAKEILCLPVFPELKEAEVKRVIHGVRLFFVAETETGKHGR
ncbi:MAG: DegT/DnrJ/EryC1/StrS family aminotransferase [candidate division FCPU426 bacterium]